MLIDEFAQWAVLILLAIFVLGLTRQLGHFIVPRRDQLLYLGPDLGKQLPANLLEGLSVEDLKRDINQSSSGLGLVAILTDKCSGCEAMVSQLEELGGPLGAPLVAVADSVLAAFNRRLEDVFLYVVYDEGGQRARQAGVIATPFVLGIDGDLNVRHRGISGGLHELAGEWLSAEAGFPEVGSQADGGSGNGILAGTTRARQEERT